MRVREEVATSLPDPSVEKYNAAPVVDCNLSAVATTAAAAQQLPTCDRLEALQYGSQSQQQQLTPRGRLQARPKSLYALSHLKSDHNPDHFLLSSYSSSSCADLSVNFCSALERQFEPSNVRQATAKYLSMLSNGAPRSLQLPQRFEQMTLLQSTSTQSILGERKPEAEATNDKITQIDNSTANENVEMYDGKVCLIILLLLAINFLLFLCLTYINTNIQLFN